MAVKYIQLADELRKKLPKYLQKGIHRLPTEMELMKLWQVSRQTVRQALALLLEEGLIEKRQGSGTYIVQSGQTSSAASHTIAILTPYAHDYTFPAALWDIQSLFSEAGYETQVFSTENRFAQERAILQNLLEHPVRALLAEGIRTAFPSPNLDLYRQLSSLGICILFYGSSPFSEEEFPCFQSDDFSGGYLLTRYLVEQGHRIIGGVFPGDSRCGHLRFSGCMQALLDCGCSFDDRHFFWYDSQLRSSASEPLDASMLTDYIQAQMSDCTAILCLSDEIAYFLIRELRRPGMFLKQMPAIAGFGSSYFSEISPVPILTASHGKRSLWTESARALLQMIGGQPVSSANYPWTVIS